jgi:tryptophan synthase alpha subunit
MSAPTATVGSSAVQARIEACRAAGRAASSATCRPASRTSTPSIAALRRDGDAGSDVVEVGLPYSDPVMDGPTSSGARDRLVGGMRHPRRLPVVEAVASDRRPHPRDDLLEPGRSAGASSGFAADLAARAAPA